MKGPAFAGQMTIAWRVSSVRQLCSAKASWPESIACPGAWAVEFVEGDAEFLAGCRRASFLEGP